MANIYNGSRELIESGDQKRGNLFYLDLFDNACLFGQCDDIWLWHKRQHHVNFDNLVNISKMKKARGLPRFKKPINVMCNQ